MPASRKPDPRAQALASFKYGMPVYGLSWPEGDTFYLCGGGGSVSTGIKNRIVAAQRVQGMLTDQLADIDFGQNCPMRLAVNPNARNIAAVMAQKSIKRVDIEKKRNDVENKTVIKLTEAKGGFAERLAADKVEYKCVTFSSKGDVLALGGVEGSLRVIGWPSLEVILHITDEELLKDGIRDISLSPSPSPQGQRVAVVTEKGIAVIWNCQTKQLSCSVTRPEEEPLKSGNFFAMKGHNVTSMQELPKCLEGARFASLRYSPPSPPSTASPSGPSHTTPATPATQPTLMYSLMNNRQGCWVVAWQEVASTGMLSMLRYRHVGEDPASCFDVSPCGKLLAVGSSNASIYVLRASDLSILRARHKAHTVFCTGVCFAPDSQHVLSASGDASVTLTSTEPSDEATLMIHRILMRLILIIGFLMTLVLMAVKMAKARGDTETFEWLGRVLRTVGIVRSEGV